MARRRTASRNFPAHCELAESAATLARDSVHSSAVVVAMRACPTAARSTGLRGRACSCPRGGGSAPARPGSSDAREGAAFASSRARRRSWGPRGLGMSNRDPVLTPCDLFSLVSSGCNCPWGRKHAREIPKVRACCLIPLVSRLRGVYGAQRSFAANMVFTPHAPRRGIRCGQANGNPAPRPPRRLVRPPRLHREKKPRQPARRARSVWWAWRGRRWRVVSHLHHTLLVQGGEVQTVALTPTRGAGARRCGQRRVQRNGVCEMGAGAGRVWRRWSSRCERSQRHPAAD